MFRRLAVVNRGEPAMRLVRAVRELNEERDLGVTVVALHTAAERRALFVRAADEAVQLRDVDTPGGPYLDHDELERALTEARADAVWVGWGFVSEDAAFADLCERMGLVFVGPSAESMRTLGDKIEAKQLAERNDVPVAPWSGGPVQDVAEAREHAERIGYPLVVKARNGGGGRGIRRVESADQLEDAFERTRSEAARTFGDEVVFLERLVAGGRHIEVQVMADGHGTVWTPGVRDCSIQRRNQKLIEESRSPALAREQEGEVRTAAADLVRAADYRGAGTVEFLYDPTDRTFAFLEVNTRLQVEHPVTEVTTGIDLVKLQLLVADGHRLEGDTPEASGHAVEARLNAEDADQDFAPAPGTVVLFEHPSGPGVRVDTGIGTGDEISPDYDSMIAKVIAWGSDRPEALARLRCALRETTVAVRGGTTTKSFLLALLEREEVVQGTADTGWLDRVGAGTKPPEHADVALLSVAVDVYDSEEAREREGFLRTARGGRPRATHPVGRPVELGYQNQAYDFVVSQLGPSRYRVHVDGKHVDVEVDRRGDVQSRIMVGGLRHQVVAIAGSGSHLVEVDGFTHRVSQDEAGLIRAPAPAVVVAVRVSVGDQVESGQTIAVLESMKMETAVRAPSAGRVRDVLASVNSQVDAGVPLLRIDQPGDEAGEAEQDAPAVTFEPGGGPDDATARAYAGLAELRALITGFDVTAERAGTVVAAYTGARDEAVHDGHPGDMEGSDDTGLAHAELAVLTTFADLCELSRNRPTREEEAADERVHSPREHFHAFLHSLDVEQESLPDTFRERLQRALRHYGVTDLEPVDAAARNELVEAVYRVFLAQQRAGEQVPVVTALLERWFVDGALLPDSTRDELGEVLDRLIVATQLRYPVIGDLARRVRFRAFDEPLIGASRAQTLSRVQEDLDYLTEHPGADDHAERVDALVASAEPLIRLLAQRTREDSTRREPLLEVLSRRYYKIRTLEDVRSLVVDGHQVVTGDFELRGDRLHLLAALAHADTLPATLERLAGIAAQMADPANLVVDLYLSWPDAPADADEQAAALQARLSEVPVLARGRRVTVTMCGPDTAVEQLTFRPSDDGPREERVIRGMHPLTGQRLDLWRLKNFEGTRLDSPEDTYLFRCVAHDNPDDERLVALAEVRDVTPLEDSAGQMIAFPAVERALAACLDGIRRHQDRRSAGRRLDANRVFLYLWPPVDVPLKQLSVFARALAPLTVGAGLEEVMILARLRERPDAELRDVALVFSYRPGTGVRLDVTDPPTEPLQPVDDYSQKVQRSRARSTVYPYELVPMLTGPDGAFTEHDLDEDGRLVPVDRPAGRNSRALVAGVVSTPTRRHPEGMRRVALFSDPTKALGSVAEPECAMVMAALDLAESEQLPVEWFALSSGAMISMDSGTENMDWVARALRRLITFTQDGGEVNVVVTGINVGAQPYWNAEATMLMHTRGILVMTPDSAMVLTGKNSLDYSGGVSAEDNFGIGGYDRVMGPNGQAQYWAPDLGSACHVLLSHYDHTYVAPGETTARKAETDDPPDRDVCDFPHDHPASEFTTVGDIFSDEANPERKKAFDIRTLMRAVSDQDHDVLERWAGMVDAETSVVLDAHLGGRPVAMIGIESRPIPRRGQFPTDGPDQWTAGTLFPRSSKKTARAVNAASGNRPLVVLANLSGFDGSPESLRNMQLEYGAEIGRAIVNFVGPIVFCVVSRYHGGAFVVFSGVLNDAMEVIAVEGSYASVIGGAPAAAVVFARDVSKRTAGDERVTDLQARLEGADGDDAARLQVELAELRETVRSEKLGEVAAEFEAVHDIARAQKVGSVHTLIAPHQLRPYLIGAVERGLARRPVPPSSEPAAQESRS